MYEAERLGFHHLLSETTVRNTYTYQTDAGQFRIEVAQSSGIWANATCTQSTVVHLSRLDGATWRAVPLRWRDGCPYGGQTPVRDLAALVPVIERKARERLRRVRATQAKEATDGRGD